MIEWFLYGAIFNFIYYLLKWDLFVVKVTIMNLEAAEDEYGSFMDTDTQNKLEDLKETCKRYEDGVDHNLLTIVMDLILYPLYALSLVIAVLDFYLIKEKK